MVSAESFLGKCGGCKYFDTTGVNGTEIGSSTIMALDRNGNESVVNVKKGVCRVNAGLRFGVLNEEVNCRQPAGVFSPKVDANQKAIVK